MFGLNEQLEKKAQLVKKFHELLSHAFEKGGRRPKKH